LALAWFCSNAAPLFVYPPIASNEELEAALQDSDDADFKAAIIENGAVIVTLEERVAWLSNTVALIERYHGGESYNLLFVPEAEWTADDEEHYRAVLKELAAVPAAGGSASGARPREAEGAFL
jgi:hypothetical protein